MLEKLSIGDWATPRDKWDFTRNITPFEVTTGLLAESYETPDPLTIIAHIRKGIHWQNKPPMNGRELTADDIVFNFHRGTGLGSDFTEPTPHWGYVGKKPFESITATDKYTVVFKLKQIDFTALDRISHLSGEVFFIYPPEVIKEQGNVQDWRNLVGTGPYSLTDWVKGSSITYTKNPDYWGYDEKFPENRLPYVDEIKMLFMKDAATKLAALRTGKLALLRNLSGEDAETIQRTNPDLVMGTSIFLRSTSSYAMDVRKPPFDDVRVRIAMQLAIDVETLHQSLYNGLGEASPQGLFGSGMLTYFVPFEEWPEEVKANFGYDPERAKQLLAEAGYPNGFKTTLLYPNNWADADIEYTQAAKDYWAKIGVDVEINLSELSAYFPRINNHTYEGMTWGNRSIDTSIASFPRAAGYSNEIWNFSGLQDPKMDALVLAQEGASIFEEYVSRAKEANMYYTSLMLEVWGPRPPVYHFWQPWLAGYNGEYLLSNRTMPLVYARLWIDQELKESMGH